jgi:hypothetical protein
MCRKLFYTVDGVSMQGWLRGEQPVRSDNSGVSRDEDAESTDTGYDFLSEPEREEALRGWARGIVRYPPGPPGIHFAQPAQPAVWIPPRYVVMLHDQVSAEAQANILARGQAIRGGSVSPRDVGRAERAFMDSIKPLLGIWYGRLMLLRTGGLPWLIAQVDPRAWIKLGGWKAVADVELLECPPPASVLWKGGDVVEMFGAETSDLCCCSLVDSPSNPEVVALEADFLDALALTLSSSAQGTVFIDIDADYAERTRPH